MSNPNQVQSVTLQTAVLMQVQEFVNAGKSFSKYDVTKALRDKCNQGLLEIPECEDGSLQSYRFNVTHIAVSGVFEQLWSSGVANQGLPPLNRNFNGTFWTYSVDSAAFAQSLMNVPPAAPVAPADPNQATSVPASSTPAISLPPGTSVPKSSINHILPASPISDSEIQRRVTIYLDHCASVGFQPTLKQIQSAIKRKRTTGLTYREIANVLRGIGRSVASV